MEDDRRELPPLRSMSVGEHLEELRTRVVWSLAAMLGCMVICWIFYDRVVVDVMRAPLDIVAGRYENPFAFRNPVLDLLRNRLPNLAGIGGLNVMSPFSPIVVKLKVSLLAGALLSSPVVIGQIWKFVESGLYPSEKKTAVTYGTASLFLFLIGCTFSFFLLFPLAIAVMLGGTQFGIVLRLEEYVSQATFFTVGVGSIFEMPLVLLFLARVGVVDITTLREKRRHVILVILVVAAMITPPDPLTQIIVAIPMLALYELSILILKMKGARGRPSNE
jgi:sec-independent protein translocase protein TatC